MTIDSPSSPPPRDTNRAGLRNAGVFLIIALTLGALFLFLDLNGEQPQQHGPARSALNDAALILSETYSDEEALQKRFQIVHQQIGSAVSLLERAAQLDSADKRELETLRVRLKALEDPSRMASSDPEQLKHSYHELIGQLHALADRLAQPES